MKKYSLQLSDGLIVIGSPLEVIDQMKTHAWGGDTLTPAEFMTRIATDNELTLGDGTDEINAVTLLEGMLAAGRAQEFVDTRGNQE